MLQDIIIDDDEWEDGYYNKGRSYIKSLDYIQW